MTEQQLLFIMPHAKARVGRFIGYLNTFCKQYGINTPLRQAHFIAQIAHESGELRYTEELASGKAYDTGRLAVRLGNTPEADGDGQRYKGRGLIQLTGLNNYKAYKADTGVDVVARPALLKEDLNAARSACWFWKKNNLNALADKDDVTAVTRRINGGTNGMTQRMTYLARAKKAFGV